MTDYQGTQVFSGMLGTVGVEYEAAYATEGALGVWDIRAKKCTYKMIQDLYMQGGIRDSRSALSPYIYRTYYEGVVEGDFINALPLHWALGDYAISAGPPYTHTMYPQRHRGVANDTRTYLRSYTIHGQYSKPDGSTTTSVDILGATVKSATFRFPLEAAATYSLNYVAKSIDTTGEATVPLTSTTMGAWNTTILIDEDTTVGTGFSGSGDGTINGLNSIEVSIDNAVTVAGEYGTTTIRQPYMGSLREGITCTIDRKYIDNDLIPSAVTEPFSLQVYMNRGTNDTIKLDINDCRFMDHERGFNYDSAIENTPMTIRPTWLKVTAVNTDTSYIL